MSPTLNRETKKISPVRTTTAQRLLFVSDRLPPYIGGMETHAIGFIEVFRKHPYIMLLDPVTFAESPELFSEAHHGAVRAMSDSIADSPCAERIPYASIYNPKILEKLIAGHGLTDGDSVFFNGLYWIRILPYLKQAFPHLRIVVRSGGNDILQAHIPDAGDDLASRQSFVAQHLNRGADTVVMNSTFSKQRGISIGIDSHRMEVVRGGVNTTLFRPLLSRADRHAIRRLLGIPASEYVVLSVCRLVSFKGIDTVLGALVRLTHDVRYVVVGSGPMREQLAQQADRLGISERIVWRPAVSHKETVRWYQAADVYCHAPIEEKKTSARGVYVHTETMGRSFCEAAAVGIPSVGTRVGGVPEVVDHETTGLLVTPQAPHELARALDILLSDSQLHYTMGVAAREKARRSFDWNIALLPAYERILESSVCA